MYVCSGFSCPLETEYICALQLYSEVELSPFKMSEEEISTQVMILSDNILQVTYNKLTSTISKMKKNEEVL